MAIDTRFITELDSTTWDFKARYAKVDSASINFRAAFQLDQLLKLAGFGDDFFEDVNSMLILKKMVTHITATSLRPIIRKQLRFSAKVDHEMDDHTPDSLDACTVMLSRI